MDASGSALGVRGEGVGETLQGRLGDWELEGSEAVNVREMIRGGTLTALRGTSSGCS